MENTSFHVSFCVATSLQVFYEWCDWCNLHMGSYTTRQLPDALPSRSLARTLSLHGSSFNSAQAQLH